MAHRKARFVFTALLGLVTGTAAASDWQPFYSDEEFSLTMDVASLVRDGLIVRAWIFSVYAEPQVAEGGAKIQAIRSRHLFDCKNRRSAVKQITIFADPKGTKVLNVGPDVADALLEWEDVPPDSVGEIQLDFACSKAPK